MVTLVQLKAMFSKKSQYAIRALLCLACHQKEGVTWLGTHYIAAETGIPKKWLANIFLELRSAGVVKSKKGAHGGYFLPQDLEDVNLAQILDVTEGWNTEKSEKEEPSEGKLEGLREYIDPVIGKLRVSQHRILGRTTLAQLLRSRNK